MSIKKFHNAVFIIVCTFILSIYSACNNPDSIPATVTFTEHVAPILYNNCTICHRQGGNAHFALITYEDARKNAGSTAYVVKEKLMPPWPADPHYTEFAGQRILSDHDIKVIQKWYAEGAPEGPKDKLPALPKYPVGSLIGTPDMSIPVQPFFL